MPTRALLFTVVVSLLCLTCNFQNVQVAILGLSSVPWWNQGTFGVLLSQTIPVGSPHVSYSLQIYKKIQIQK